MAESQLADIRSCPACMSQDLETFYEVSRAPLESCLLFDERTEAQTAGRRPIRLCLCHDCGFIFNRSYDPAAKLATSSYDETQSFSPYFRSYSEQLSLSLIDEYGLRNKTVLEIGCGPGQFLLHLCAEGNNNGLGFDPAFRDEDLRSFRNRKRIRIIKDYFDNRYTDLDVDFILCRHTLEHIHAVRDFLRPVRQLAGRSMAPVFFEVPDAGRILRDAALWDIYYEHCSYFTMHSLSQLFRSAGFEILRLRRAFDDQYLLIECRASSEKRQDQSGGAVKGLREEVDDFRKSAERVRRRWRELLLSHLNAGTPAVLWGSAAKASALLVALDLEAAVGYVVNINPLQQGKYVSGTGLQVVAPEFLRTIKPGLVISMNHVYENEIGATLDEMGLATRLISVQRALPLRQEMGQQK